MYESKVKYFYGTGRRKHSVARVRIYPGNGNITINGRGIDDYFGLETLKLIVRQPLALTDNLEKFDIVCTVCGGGVFQELFLNMMLNFVRFLKRKVSSLVTQE